MNLPQSIREATELEECLKAPYPTLTTDYRLGHTSVMQETQKCFTIDFPYTMGYNMVIFQEKFSLRLLPRRTVYM